MQQDDPSAGGQTVNEQALVARGGPLALPKLRALIARGGPLALLKLKLFHSSLGTTPIRDQED